MNDRTFKTSPFYLSDRELMEAADICLCVLMMRQDYRSEYKNKFMDLSTEVRKLEDELL